MAKSKRNPRVEDSSNGLVIRRGLLESPSQAPKVRKYPRRHLAPEIQPIDRQLAACLPTSHKATLAVGSPAPTNGGGFLQDAEQDGDEGEVREADNTLPNRGQQEPAVAPSLPQYDPKCYLCPGNARAAGDLNPKYEKTFAFVNDYSAVKEQQPDYESESKDDLESQLLRAQGVKGVCYVLTFSPRHDLTLADMPALDILPVIEHWTRIYANHLCPTNLLTAVAEKLTLSMKPEDAPRPNDTYRYMQIFENKGAAMGCSNPHPHCQVWTTSEMPEEPGKELVQMTKYRKEHGGRHLLEDYVKLELAKEERVLYQNDTFLVVCPWWAIWPFETLIIAKRHLRSLVDFGDKERLDFADAIQEVTRRYDNLFECNFPYSSGIHQAPLHGTDEEIENSYFHMHFYPPLLRSATVRKFLVGYELMAEPQRDITPEQATAKLRNCSGELYRKKLV